MRSILPVVAFTLISITVLPLRAQNPKEDTVVKQCLTAIEKQDFETIEGLRDKIKKQHIPQIAATWKKTMPWKIKDAYMALLMDQKDEDVLVPMMEDALDSPTPESRAYAFMILKKDFSYNKVFWDKKGWIIPAKVDAAVKALKAERKKK